MADFLTQIKRQFQFPDYAGLMGMAAQRQPLSQQDIAGYAVDMASPFAAKVPAMLGMAARKAPAQPYGLMNTAGPQARQVLDTVPDLDPVSREFLQGKVSPPPRPAPQALTGDRRARVLELAQMLRSPTLSQRELAEQAIVDEFGGMGTFQSLYSGIM